jgi:hypothetical protein
VIAARVHVEDDERGTVAVVPSRFGMLFVQVACCTRLAACGLSRPTSNGLVSLPTFTRGVMVMSIVSPAELLNVTMSPSRSRKLVPIETTPSSSAPTHELIDFQNPTLYLRRARAHDAVRHSIST